MTSGAPGLIVSCEHGGNRIPEAYRHLFHGARQLLCGHRGYDLGILPLARKFAQTSGVPLLSSEVSRLLVDLNRTLRQRTLFSELTRHLPDLEKQRILENYYHPYHEQLRQEIRRLVAENGRVIHLSVHSFTPELDGDARTADLGFMYDPSRPVEAALCLRWKNHLQEMHPGLRLRRNYPYNFRTAGLLLQLYREFDPGAYVGIALEVNQALPLQGGGRWTRVQDEIIVTFRQLVA